VTTDGAAPSFDLADPRWSTDPHAIFGPLRERAPVHRTAEGFWVVTRHADAMAVLRDRRVSSDATTADPDAVDAVFRATPDEGADAFADLRPFLFRDPPDHTRLRGLVAKAFTPRVVESLRERTAAIVDELLDAAAAGPGPVDLVEAFAYPLPVRVICDLLGVPVEDQDRFKAWSHALARGLDPEILLTDEARSERDLAGAQFAQYFFELLAGRRRSPGEDLLSRLVAAEDGGATLNEMELLSTCILLLVAGHETTVNLIAGGALALLRHPDQAERFRSDPGVVRTGVEEMLRFVSPVQLTGRTVLEDLPLEGATLPAGHFVMVLLASGNRDPAAFDDPGRFDVGRTPNNHLGFGFGIHHCLGAPLARMETQVALTTLVRRFPSLALAVEDVTWKSNVVLRGMEALPVTLHG
jgi:cytochrome P450